MPKYLLLILAILVTVAGIYLVLFKVNSQQESKGYTDISAKDLKTILASNKEIFLIDVHTPKQKHIEGTDEFIPFDKVSDLSYKLPEDKSAEIVVYCRSGNMSETAAEELLKLGYTNVKNLLGGTYAWEKVINE